ncbi:LAMI_0F07734g1_1 [Lachancea mirantina]|uniref:LAMI_0F07734g1_1 n=1 Tax=Lachancea mirantina TaxID=1230905 RepID=A0A1G4JZX1_9SACH|nr:LAMI_0F07734g1_1 [Lachancea mirantina]
MTFKPSSQTISLKVSYHHHPYAMMGSYTRFIIFILSISLAGASSFAREAVSGKLSLATSPWVSKASDFDKCENTILKELNGIVDSAERLLYNMFQAEATYDSAREVYGTCRQIEQQGFAIQKLFLDFQEEASKAGSEDLNAAVAQIARFVSKTLETESRNIVPAGLQISGNEVALLRATLVKNLIRIQKALRQTEIQLQAALNFHKLKDQKIDNVTMETIPDATALDEDAVGVLIGNIIADKIHELVVGGDLHTAITQIANSFCDLGVLLTGYATGLALCNLAGVPGAVFCGISIVVCSGGTVVFFCRLYNNLNKLFKSLA